MSKTAAALELEPDRRGIRGATATIFCQLHIEFATAGGFISSLAQRFRWWFLLTVLRQLRTPAVIHCLWGPSGW